MFRTLSRHLFTKQYYCIPIVQRNFLSHYPIDETIFGLSSDQISVSIFVNRLIILIISFQEKHFISQLRETIFNFAQKELAPHAQTIDEKNEFK